MLGKDHADTAESYFFLGLNYSRQNDLFNSIENYRKALDIRREILGNEHPLTALACNNIGSVNYRAGNYQKALEYHLEALEIKRKLADKADLAFACNKAAMDNEALGDKEHALEYYEQALEIYSSIDHSDADEIRQSIARLKGEPE